jgi:hypothetical protein
VTTGSTVLRSAVREAPIRGRAARKALIANIVGMIAIATTIAHWAVPSGARRVPVRAATSVQLIPVPRIESEPAAMPGTAAITREPTRM